MSDILLSPVQIGDWWIPNRVLMAPLTRSRSTPPGDVPNELMATYYGQRASAGLIISEATQISAMGKGYAFTPGIHTPEQMEGWRLVTERVHAGGGRILLQLWHVGRISHHDLLPGRAAPIAPSAIAAKSQTYVSATSGMVPVSAPRALETSEIPTIVQEYAQAARFAHLAGFDGVEIHGANGYLIDQFLRSSTNQRTDAYGGSVEKRLRFALEVTDAVAGVFGPGRVGFRISPTGTFNDIKDDDPSTTFATLARELMKRRIAYLHVVEAFAGQARDAALLATLREAFPGRYIANGGYTAETAREAVMTGRADAVTFGEPFIANPDLPERIRAKAAWAKPDRSTYYGGDARGYTDYPALPARA